MSIDIVLIIIVVAVLILISIVTNYINHRLNRIEDKLNRIENKLISIGNDIKYNQYLINIQDIDTNDKDIKVVIYGNDKEVYKYWRD